MENDPLATYLEALARDDCYRVHRVLKANPHETTEVVFFMGANNAALGPFVRKRISGEVPLGSAYGLLMEAQRSGRRFRHLPRIYDVHERDGDLVVVMEFVGGRTLRDVVYERDASLALAREVFPALCDGAIELHEGFTPPLIHRDLKPSNIIVSDGGLTIIDFGIARSFRAGADADTTHFGTRSYAPPEQFGYGQTDVRSDVYALGMLLYYLVTERDPDAQVATAGFAEPDVPPVLRPVLQRACAFDPSARFQTVRDLKAAFLAAASEPVGVPSLAAMQPTMGQPVSAAQLYGVPMAAEQAGTSPVVPAPGSSVPAPTRTPGTADAAAPKAPFGSGKVWSPRSVSAVAVCGLFTLISALCAFGTAGGTAAWPLALRILYYWPFASLFFGGVACLWMGDALFAKLFGRFGLNTRARKRLVGWGLIVLSSFVVTGVTGLAESLGFPTAKS
ncbi:protein kinase [Eggerthellaceae bacterium 24-137]